MFLNLSPNLQSPKLGSNWSLSRRIMSQVRSDDSTVRPSQSAPSNPSSCESLHPRIHHKYKLGNRLGRGCFATVYKAERRSDNGVVAVKVVEKRHLDDETANLLQTELQILQAVSEHPGIVKMLDNLETDTHMYFVMEYIDGGPLLDRIVSRGTFSENDARIMMRTILLTLQFLSKLGFVHRDIKPENILVDNHSKAWSAKLTDFGLSAKMQPDEMLREALGTPLFTAPEIFKGQGYDCSCDMWSLGVVLYIVLCGYPPFPYDHPNKLVSSIISCDYSFTAPEWDKVSLDAKDFLSRVLETDPSQRLTPDGALNHPWITVAQSTSDLPNSNLQKFNARRKLKALMFGVLTTFDFRNICEASRKGQQNPSSQKDLIAAVQKNRDLIERMGIIDDCSTNGKESQPEPEQPKLKPSRRSLVLPMNALASESENKSSSSFPTADLGRLYHMPGSGVLNSQLMQSRTLAMVAEVREHPELTEASNPFMVSEESESSARGPLLPKLDFTSLGLP